MTRLPPFNQSPQRILVRSVNWLGDAVMSTPALLRLRERFSTAHITLLTPGKLADLWQYHPAIDEVVSFTADENIFAIARKLRPVKFDLALVLPNSPRSALEPWLARIPQRIGYTRPWRNFFLTQIIPSRAGAVKMHKRSAGEIQRLISAAATKNPQLEIPRTAHQVFEYLHLTAALGASSEPLPPQLFVTLEELAATTEKFSLNQTTTPVFGLNPGAEYGPAKRWPVEKFIATITEISRQTNCTWILFGGKGDLSLGAQIEAAGKNSNLKIHNLTGRTSLRELMALLKRCRVLLTNDTGPAHVAAALGTPVVIPFGSTSPELTAPGLPGDPRNYLLKSNAPCAPCFLRECPIDFRCMNDLSVERVVTAVLAAANQ